MASLLLPSPKIISILRSLKNLSPKHTQLGINFSAQVVKMYVWPLRFLYFSLFFSGVFWLFWFFTILMLLVLYFCLCIFPKSYADCQLYFLKPYIWLSRKGNQKKSCFDILDFFNLRFFFNATVIIIYTTWSLALFIQIIVSISYVIRHTNI